MFNPFTMSRFRGRPITLYRFSHGSNVYTYTDADFPVTRMNGVTLETYAPLAIDRTTATNNGTLDRSTLEVSFPRTCPVAELFRIYPPSGKIGLTIYEREAEDPDNETRTLWHGRVLGCEWSGSEAKVGAEPISTALGRIGLRRNYQYMCPHLLYGPRCKATKVVTPAAVQAVVGRQVTLDLPPADGAHYAGGMIQWGEESRTILSVSGAVLSLAGLPFGLQAGVSVGLVKGCAHTLSDCRT
jgi:hypothetical protein